MAAVAIVCLVAPARSAPRSLWIELPRAQAFEESGDYPYPPAPTPEALQRRALRGRPDRVATLSRGPRLEDLRAIEATGARIRSVSRWLSAVSVDAEPAVRARLAARFGREALRPVARLEATPAPPTPQVGIPAREVADTEYGLSRIQIRQIGLDLLHERGLTGAGVRVLVVDTGFALDHPALGATQVEATWDFLDDDPVVANEEGEPDAQDRHGTGVLGVMGGYVSGDLVGGARGARYLLAKTERVGSETRVEEDAYVAALEWGEALGADVMNGSLGYRVFNDEPDTFAYTFDDLDGDTAVTTRAIDDMVALGVVAVVSAGNNGLAGAGTLGTPADADSALTVAAVDSLGVVASFSSRGPTADGRTKPDVAALGVRVRWARQRDGDPTGWASGTSVASPLVASAVALTLEAHPAWGPGDVAAALRGTASQAARPDDDLGWGLIDAHAAVFEVEEPTLPLPFSLLDAEGGIRSGAGEDVVLAWHAAEDLQTPNGLDYRVTVSRDPLLNDVRAVFEAGPDTSTVARLTEVGTWWWRVEATDPQGNTRRSSVARWDVEVSTDVGPVPAGPWVRWDGVWPNPSRQETTLRLALDRPGRLESLSVYDVAGRRVRSLDTERDLVAGTWRYRWDGRDTTGQPAAAGIYLIRAVVRGRTGDRFEVVGRVTRLR